MDVEEIREALRDFPEGEYFTRESIVFLLGEVDRLTQENQNNCDLLQAEKDTVNRIEDFSASVFNVAFENEQKLMAIIDAFNAHGLTSSDFRARVKKALYGE